MGSATNKPDHHRQYEGRYALDNTEGVRRLLADYHALKQRRFAGDNAASDILIDLQTAIERAGLTDRQRQAMHLVYGEDLTQTDAGERMGVSKQTVNRLINVASAKVAQVYESWCRRGEGYVLSEREDAE
ncbi:sigma factor-like helix-turn-helix DNA-binding protein [Cytobacillus sp. FSL K6-0129]|uniref:sigma factor-like helix-turn-helix DNA-binding protein n=1 Tax=Cytobacillus sp. FSL K6-0129 TaxID=2921421 RepID=UPI0030F9A2FB